MKEVKRVSFDDKTLNTPGVQKFAEELIKDGYEVWVTTSRFDDCHLHLRENKLWKELGLTDLWELVDRIGIPRYRMRFTNMMPKWEYLDKTNMLFHLDDDIIEIMEANDNHCSVPFIFHVESSDIWKEQCLKIINK